MERDGFCVRLNGRGAFSLNEPDTAGVFPMKSPEEIEGAMAGEKPGSGKMESSNGMTLEMVMAAHESALLRYAARLLNNAEAAQDVVQDAFIRLHRNWGTRVSDDGRLPGWLYRTTHNAAVDYIRRESRLKRLHEAHAQEVDSADRPTQTEALEAKDRRQLALEHLARLESAEREVLVLRLQEGLSYREISRVTGRTEGNVGCLLHHATRNLTQNLKKAGVI